MLDSILAVVLPIHIVAGAISALVAFPVAAFAVKGSRPHVAAGRCFVLGYVVVCLTGLLLEMERTTGGTIRVLWTEFKLVGPKVSDSGHLPPLLFFATATLDLAFLYLASVLVQRAMGTTVQGWATIMVALLFLGGVQLICLGIMGEYLGRVFNEIKPRPIYVVERVLGDEASGSASRPQ